MASKIKRCYAQIPDWRKTSGHTSCSDSPSGNLSQIRANYKSAGAGNVMGPGLEASQDTRDGRSGDNGAVVTLSASGVL